MILVLIRHAAAEEFSAAKEDRYRELTPSGRSAFQATAEGLRRLFPHAPRILTSPFTRAQQTAKLLAQRFGNAPIELCDELAASDLEPFLEQCRAKPGIVFAIGHEPVLSIWLSHLTGQNRHFEKGAAAAIELGSAGPGELLFYADPDSFSKLNERAFPFRLFADLLMFRDRMLHGDHSEDTIHDLRVSMRQLKVMLYGIKPLLPHEDLVNVLSGINGLFAYTDKVRDYDVLLEFIRHADEPSAALPPFIRGLRDEQLSALLAAMGEENAALSLLRLFRLLASVDIKSCRKTSRKRFVSLIRKTRKHLEALDMTNELALHRLRIYCKKIYYSGNLFPFASKICGKNILEQSKALKDALGAHHDLFVCRRLLENSLNGQSPALQEPSRPVLAQLLKKQRQTEDLEKQIRTFKKSLRF